MAGNCRFNNDDDFEIVKTRVHSHGRVVLIEVSNGEEKNH